MGSLARWTEKQTDTGKWLLDGTRGMGCRTGKEIKEFCKSWGVSWGVPRSWGDPRSL